MRKHIIRLGAGLLGAAMLLPGLALAGHYGYGGPAAVSTTTYGTTHVRGGPPAWAPAHGYRHKHQHHRRHGKGRHYAPVVRYHVPVRRTPAYRYPTTVYHGSDRSTLDFTIHYSTRY